MESTFEWPKAYLEYLAAPPALVVVYFELADRVGWLVALIVGAVAAVTLIFIGKFARRRSLKGIAGALADGALIQGPSQVAAQAIGIDRRKQVTKITLVDSPGASVSLDGAALPFGPTTVATVQNAPLTQGTESDWTEIRPQAAHPIVGSDLGAPSGTSAASGPPLKQLDRDIEEGMAALMQARDGRNREANANLGIELLERAMERSNDAIAKAKLKGNIANGWLILAELGEPEDRIGKALNLMYDASVAFRDEPERFADNQLNMGCAYLHLASLRDKDKNATLAIASLKRAIEGFENLGAGEKVAMARINLGSAYHELAEVRRTAENSHLAIEAYESARTGLGNSHELVEGGTLENNLGTAYLQLSFVEDRRLNIERAIEHLSAALRAVPLERFPIRWALAHRNLGAAHRMLAELTDWEGNLQKAIQHLQESLRVFDRATSPTDFGHVQKLLAITYLTRAQHSGSETSLHEVLEHADLALAVLDRAKSPQDFASLQDARGGALMFLGVLHNQTRFLEEAIEAFDQALEVRRLDLLPIDHAGSLHNRSIAKMELALRTQSGELLGSAISDLKTALEIRAGNGVSHHLAATHLQLGKALFVQAAWEKDQKTLNLAIDHLVEAERVGKVTGDERVVGLATQVLVNARSIQATGRPGRGPPEGYA
jgi:tetratricopeptide (TPR) repeat protein